MRKFLLSFTIALIISSCASVPKQSFNSAANSNINNIAVILPPAIEEVSVRMEAHPGESFGLIGGLAAIADMAKKTNDYNHALESDKIDWSSFAQQQLIEELQKVGYKVTSTTIRNKGDTNFDYLKNYPTNASDALLDFKFILLQRAAGATTGYVPTVELLVRLVGMKDKKIIYEEAFIFGLTTRYELDHGYVSLPAKLEYKDIDELVAGSQASSSELKRGISQIAQHIAHDLKKQTGGEKN